MSAATSSYWCYRCSRFVRVSNDPAVLSASVVCSNCDSGFVEVIDNPTPANVDSRRSRRFPTAAMYMIGANSTSNSNPGHTASAPSGPRRLRRNNGDRSPFNPVVVLRGTTSDGTANEEGRGFELFYDDGAGSGLRPLPASMSEFLLGSGSGLDRLIEQLSQIEINGIGRCEERPAAKSAIESMRTVELDAAHIAAEHHCAVCKEAFEVGAEAREMPCKHIYHSDCILPWLSLRNSCPVCRHELPTDSAAETGERAGEDGVGNEGLTIWRLPGGGFAVGRFSGGRRGAERELPVVYTEMDGGFNGAGAPRRISWSRNGGRGEQRSGWRRIFRGMFGCFGGNRSWAVGSGSEMRLGTPPTSPPRSTSRRRVRLMDMEATEASTPRRRRTWSMDVNSGIVRW